MTGYPLIFPINLFVRKVQTILYSCIIERNNENNEKRKMAGTGKKGGF